MTTFMPIPIPTSTNGRKRRGEKFVQIIEVDIYPKKWYRREARYEEYEARFINASEIIGFSPAGEINGQRFTEIETESFYITIKGSPDELRRKLETE